MIVDYFFYAETAFHHEGDYEYLKSLVDIAADMGCQGIKFQILINLDDFMSTLHPNYNMAQKWVFSESQWKEIIEYTHSKQMKIVAMPCDVAAVEMLEALPFTIDFYDIHSVSFYDSVLLDAVRSTNKPVILGVGGRTLEEILVAKTYFDEQLAVLMVGFQAFPSDLKNVKLQKIALLKQLFSNCLIGYADHTSYDSEYAIKSLEYAFILGARVFEKHITMVEGEKRTDFEAALGKNKIKKIIKNLTYIEKLLDDDAYRSLEHSKAEIEYRNRQKKLVACEDIKKKDYFSLKNTKLKMTSQQDEGYNQYFVGSDKNAVCDIKNEQVITRKMIK